MFFLREVRTPYCTQINNTGCVAFMCTLTLTVSSQFIPPVRLVHERQLRLNVMWVWYGNTLTQRLAVASHAKTVPINHQGHIARMRVATPLDADVHARSLAQHFHVTCLGSSFEGVTL